MYTEYCTSGDVLGELSCLLKREIEYTAICETTLQVQNSSVVGYQLILAKKSQCLSLGFGFDILFDHLVPAV